LVVYLDVYVCIRIYNMYNNIYIHVFPKLLHNT